jgi:hypothetical protein
MLYFHPWEFDPDQARLPLRRLSAFRTYVGLSRSRARLVALLRRHAFTRAIDVAKQLDLQWFALPSFSVAARQALREQGLAVPEPAVRGGPVPCPERG